MVEHLFEFLKKVDRDFPTPLSERVDLHEYASKLADAATISAIFDANQIIGVVALYCNDPNHEYSYIPLVAVLPEMRGRKLSKSLMASAISIAKENGFKTLGIHTENPAALHLYLKLGFRVIEDSERKYLELNF